MIPARILSSFLHFIGFLVHLIGKVFDFFQPLYIIFDIKGDWK